MTFFWLEFQYPFFLFLFLLTPLFFYMEYLRSRKWITIANFNVFKKIYKRSSLLHYFQVFIRFGIFVIFVLLLANPWYTNISQLDKKKWIDLVFVLDISKSMLAEDMKPNRLETAKKVMEDFVGKITSDRLGFVLFAGKPFVSIPLTFDYWAVINYIKNITTDSINQEIPGLSGTAIGDGLLMASDILTKSGSENREKVVILLTDWEANMWIEPKIATNYIKDKKIKVYSIWIGDINWVELFITDRFGQKQYFLDASWTPIKATLDEEMLKYISSQTNWEYFIANSWEVLKQVFDKLSKLNKKEIETNVIKTFVPQYKFFLLLLIFLLIINLLISYKNAIIKS